VENLQPGICWGPFGRAVQSCAQQAGHVFIINMTMMMDHTVQLRIGWQFNSLFLHYR